MSFYETQMDVPMKMLIDCPRECKTVSYEINYSNSNYPSYTEYLNFLNNSYLMSKYLQTPSVEDIKKSMATLYIYYDDLRYTSISQQPKMMFFDLTITRQWKSTADDDMQLNVESIIRAVNTS